MTLERSRILGPYWRSRVSDRPATGLCSRLRYLRTAKYPAIQKEAIFWLHLVFSLLFLDRHSSGEFQGQIPCTSRLGRSSRFPRQYSGPLFASIDLLRAPRRDRSDAPTPLPR